MCGICGKLMFDREEHVSPSLVKSMADAIRHRGPDDEGYHFSGQIGLGFRRLSIIDLNTGHQPIANEDGSIWVVFNGEIYNYCELRAALVAKGHSFKTLTDTEVLVHLYEEHGSEMLVKLRGMFSFAIWDENHKSLFLARDRVGIKPLYYCITNRSLSFGSEIKAVLADPAIRREVDPAIIDRFLTFYYLPGEETLLKGVRKLPPGSYLIAKDGATAIHQYWDLHFEHAEPSPNIYKSEACLLELLQDTLQLHMVSDVPVGFLLSGGIDSTAMLSLASEQTNHSLSSFTIGFNAPGVTDERPYARLAAQRFGTTHHELTISPVDFVDFLPSYVWHMEEPVCEPPAIALYYISRLARSHVKVLISGEGGDEAFAGYSNYRNLLWLERFKRIPGPVRSTVHLFLAALYGMSGFTKFRKYGGLMDVPLDKYYYSRTSSPLTFFNNHGSDLYSGEFSHLVSKTHSLRPIRRFMTTASEYGPLDKMLYVDTKSWLPDDLLVKADKMTMANSIELRVPLLDHELLEFAATLPPDFKVRGFTTKYLAKRTLSRHVPKQILKRPKAGFPVPYESWLRTDLRSWLLDVLFDPVTLDRGYFERKAIEDLIERDQRSGGYSKEIFSLAVLELWHRAFLRPLDPSVTSTDSYSLEQLERMAEVGY